MLPDHHISHGNALIDQPGDGEGIQFGGDDHHAFLLRQGHHPVGDFHVQADHNAADMLIQGLELIPFPVPENDHVPLLQDFTQKVRIGRPHQDPAARKVRVFIPGADRPPDRFSDPSVLCSRVGQQEAALRVHEHLRNITDRDQAFQLVMRVDHRHGRDAVGFHHIPSAPQGHACLQVGRGEDVHVLDLGADIGHISGLGKAEAFQHILRFLIDLPGPAGNIPFALGNLVSDTGIGDGGTDGIGIRILVSQDINGFMLSHMSVLLSSRCRQRPEKRLFALRSS